MVSEPLLANGAKNTRISPVKFISLNHSFNTSQKINVFIPNDPNLFEKIRYFTSFRGFKYTIMVFIHEILVDYPML